MPMRIGVAFESPPTNGCRYDTTKLNAVVCDYIREKNGSRDQLFPAGLKPGIYNGQDNGLRVRMLDARVAPTAWDIMRRCDAPIRPGGWEFRGTTCWQNGADFRGGAWCRGGGRPCVSPGKGQC